MPRLDDYGHELAEESLRKLERRFASIYSQAAREMREKQEKEMAAYQRELSQRLKALDDTPEARKKHEDWLAEQAMRNRWVGDMSDRLANKATEGNALAMQALNDTLPTVYAENANWAAYTVDKAVGYDTSFTLVDADTVRNLVTGSASTEAVGSRYARRDGSATAGGRLLPEITFPAVDRRKDYRWNRQRFNSAITQGILQGESIPNIVKRTESIFGMNKAAATRAARTATTCAENSGRVSSYERAQGMGIELKQEWVAALDGRTRESHRKLDGVKVAVGEEFEAERGKLRFPGDPQGHPSEVYNCRCTLVAAVDGVDQEDAARWSRLPEGMTYDEWREGKPIDRAESYKNPARIKEPGWSRSKVTTQDLGGIVNGADILGTWQRRPDEFDFEIEDVMAAQGFDGKPRIVDADEFDRAVRQANGGEGLVMQRVYSAPDRATLDAYRESLYDGKWYVDCSKGGSAYGQGMYAVSDFKGNLTKGITDEIETYKRGPIDAVETMTLDPSARFVEYNDAAAMKANMPQEITDKYTEKFIRDHADELGEQGVEFAMRQAKLGGYNFDFNRMMELDQAMSNDARRLANRAVSEGSAMAQDEIRELYQMDIGAYAALRGYDAISVTGRGMSGSYTVVLNRTKLIIRRPE